jgi:hypothetical protein
MQVSAANGDREIGRSGRLDPRDNAVDPRAHFVNAFVIDREGNRIDRRNAEDIFVALYNNQIPPGAADVVHYRLHVPPDARGAVTIDARLLYRKFDTEYMRLVTGEKDYFNDLPIITLAQDRIVLPLDDDSRTEQEPSPIEPWQRWNDYGIGLLRKGQLGELRQAAQAFAEVEKLGRPDGPLNLARVYIKEGRVQKDAQEALARAAASDPKANEWSLLWFGAAVAEANGDYDLTIANLERIVQGGFEQAQGRGFDFSKDYRVLNALGNALYQRGLIETGESRTAYLERARNRFLEALSYDPENLTAHWNLQRIYGDLGDRELADEHARLHATYKPDDNARDYAVAQARLKYPAANRKAEAVVIYELDTSDDSPAYAEVRRDD